MGGEVGGECQKSLLGARWGCRSWGKGTAFKGERGGHDSESWFKPANRFPQTVRSIRRFGGSNLLEPDPGGLIKGKFLRKMLKSCFCKSKETFFKNLTRRWQLPRNPILGESKWDRLLSKKMKLRFSKNSSMCPKKNSIAKKQVPSKVHQKWTKPNNDFFINSDMFLPTNVKNCRKVQLLPRTCQVFGEKLITR